MTVVWATQAEAFQPTLPHGERLLALKSNDVRQRFQPTLPHGERLRTLGLGDLIVEFQPTLPHGERRAWCRNPSRLQCHFNPRSRTGSDAPKEDCDDE